MFQRWPKRDPNKHYYLVPNEVFNLGLSSHEIAVYNYLLRCEDRRTYQCHPSYRTIGKAVQLSENTVRKYVAGLEEKGLIRTEPSTIITKDAEAAAGVFHGEQPFLHPLCPDVDDPGRDGGRHDPHGLPRIHQDHHVLLRRRHYSQEREGVYL